MLCIITGGRELVEYEIQLEALHTETVNHISRAIVKIVFRRNMMFHVTNTFLQTGLLVAVGGLTLFFAIDNFTDRIMVTLTTLLVIATVTASIQAASTLSAPIPRLYRVESRHRCTRSCQTPCIAHRAMSIGCSNQHRSNYPTLH